MGEDDIAVTSRIARSAVAVMRKLDTLPAVTAALTALLGGDLAAAPAEGTAPAPELLPMYPQGTLLTWRAHRV